MNHSVEPAPTRLDLSPIRDLVVAGGGLARLADTLGITREAILQWGRVPIRHAVVVARATGVPVWVIRPDFYGQLALEEALNAHFEKDKYDLEWVNENLAHSE